MQNLYWKTGDGKTLNLVETPFAREEEFEDYLYHNQRALEDIFVFNRQIRTGSKQGIPDMLGVDQDGKICLIEIKNAAVTEDVLPQVLGYAIWAETNPDSIKALWLEAKNRPEDIEINWDGLELRVLIIGPAFRSNVLRMSYKLNYAVKLLRVKRFVTENEEFILVDQLEEQPEVRVVTTKARQAYDATFYSQEHGKEAADEFLRAVGQAEAVIKKHGWQLQTKFNKSYAVFKYGGTNPFSVSWSGTRAWNVKVKVSEQEAESFKTENWEFQRYDSGWKQGVFRRKNPKAHLSELESLLALAYEKVRVTA